MNEPKLNLDEPTNEPRTTAEFCRDLAARCARQFEAGCNGNPWPCFYLWYRRAKPGQYGDVMVAAAKPEGYVLAWGEKIPLHIPKDEIFGWLLEKIRKCPILDPDDLHNKRVPKVPA